MPRRCVGNTELETRLGVSAGWIGEKTGIHHRHYADPATESSPVMAAHAIRAALGDSGDESPTDLLVCASAIGSRPLPATSCLVQRELGPAWAGVPCMDVNCTCLGFLCALDMVASHLACGRFRRVVIVCSEIASLGMNWAQPGSATLFGDAAVAFVVETAGDFPPRSAFLRTDPPALLHCRMATFSEGADFCTVRGGGLELPGWQYQESRHADYLFHMDGLRIHELASRRLPPFVREFLEEAETTLDEIDLVIPHQAGLLPLRIMQRKLGIPSGRFVITLARHGNVISASIPLALHLSRQEGRAHPGQRVLLLGTAAGLTLGAALLRL